MLSGARQIGKTTLLLQAIEGLLNEGVAASNILYATFDHPIIKMAGIDAVLQAWREREPIVQGAEYLFLDEAQFINDWGVWVKHQVDFNKNRRVIFTGSAMPVTHRGQESGVGRWHTIKLATLSFYEYLQLKQFAPAESGQFRKIFFNFKPKPEGKSFLYDKINKRNINKENEESWENLEFKFDIFKKNFELMFEFTKLPKLPEIKSLNELFNWSLHEFQRTTELAMPYVAHFHQYLVRGGFPQTAQVESVTQAQSLIREDIIDKMLKRDMTAFFGVRNVLDLEQTFLYLCMHDGCLLDMPMLCSNLGVKRPTAQHFVELLEATHLIYRLQPFGYGKEILRGRFKIYLADAAIAPSVLLKGTSILDDHVALGVSIETAFFKHLFVHYAKNSRITYWQDDKKHEEYLLMEDNNEITPFVINYHSQHVGTRNLKGLLEFCQKKSVKHAYIITKSLDDFGLLENPNLCDTHILKIPASLFCYWTGKLELSQTVTNENLYDNKFETEK